VRRRIRISAQPHHAYVDEQPRARHSGAAVAGILVARPLFALRLLRLLPISAITRAVMVRAMGALRARPRVAAAYWFIRQMPRFSAANRLTQATNGNIIQAAAV